MPSFSERMGIVQPRDVIQKDSIDTALRNRLWDIVREGYLVTEMAKVEETRLGSNYRVLWIDFWQRAGDTVPAWCDDAGQQVRAWFYAAAWNQVYDFVEFVIRRCERRHEITAERLVTVVNEALETNLSAYRWIEDEFAPINDEDQIKAIKQAIAHPLAGVRVHLSKALAHASDRTSPDVENSIKESVSAVESLCSAIVGKKATLGEAIKKLQANGIKIPGALEKGWLALYGYTSDADGIRHAAQAESDLTVADAMYFLVSCSAFVSLLTEKALEAGLSVSAVDR